MAEELRAEIEDAVKDLPPRERRDDATLREAARLAIRRALKAYSGKRPLIDVHLVRIGSA
jgi:ribonuclease J